ncbi:hypothetical protein ALP65_00709 [Pseudomonas aeruginosa]|uniref:Uncharacterized protein n=1 Tax=Pseudomonas aeruginosa TaxID=287 RepID=A0A3M5DQJ0_PSEAI|nr:hypothetical protein ALP65_00709 [Pseudomonas aeruginosa]
MTPAQIARQLNCSEKNVYAMLAEAIAGQQVSLEQALDLPEELLGEIQDAFLEEDGELPRRWRRWRSVSASGCRVACCTACAPPCRWNWSRDMAICRYFLTPIL